MTDHNDTAHEAELLSAEQLEAALSYASNPPWSRDWIRGHLAALEAQQRTTEQERNSARADLKLACADVRALQTEREELLAQQRTDRETIAELRKAERIANELRDQLCHANKLIAVQDEVNTTLEARLEEAKRALEPFAGKTVFFPNDPHQLVDIGCRVRDLRRVESILADLPATPKWLECVREVSEYWTTAVPPEILTTFSPRFRELLDRLTEAMKGTK